MLPHVKMHPIVLTVHNPEGALKHLEHERMRRDGDVAEYAWMTATGKVVLLKDMEDGHLNNTIKMLRSKVFNDKLEKLRSGSSGIDVL